jgi:lipopolysaccharide transport system ATP-binding protein
MSDIAIRVENLGKKYKIGANQARYQTLRESIVNGFSNSIESIKGAPPKENNIIWALKDINFEVKHGEVLGIIGRNGAGKSTLLKILSRITKPTTGRFELNGRVGSLLEVGTGFHPELTGRENIYLSGAILGMKRNEINRKFDEIVDFAEIEKFLDTPAKHYSSGMYMRLAFSVAAHLEPEILLVDEVLAVGDAEFQKKCLGKMGDVAGEGRTVLFVSHNMGAVKQLCKKTISLDKGRLLFIGKTWDVIDNYININIPKTVGKIIDHLIVKDTDLSITGVKVNEQQLDNIFLTQNDNILSIQISGEIKREMRIDIEFRILDQYENVLAFFSTGHFSGISELFPQGNFSIERKAKLPKGINNGVYYLSIYLTEPNNYGWADLEKAVIIHHEGIITKTGLSFKQGSKQGWLLLEEA